MEKLSKHPSAPAFTVPTAARVTIVTNTGPHPTGLAYDFTPSPKHIPTALMAKTPGRSGWDMIPPTLAAVEAAGKPHTPSPMSPKGPDMSRIHGRELPMAFMGAPAPYIVGGSPQRAEKTGAAADGGRLPTVTAGPGHRRHTPPLAPPGIVDMKRTTGRKNTEKIDERPALEPERDDAIRPRYPTAQFERSPGRKQPMSWFETLEEFSNAPGAPCRCESPQRKRPPRVEAMGRTTGREARVVHGMRMFPDKYITKDVQHDYKEHAIRPQGKGLPMGATPHARADVDDILHFCDAQLRLLRDALATTKAGTPKPLPARPPPAMRSPITREAPALAPA
eukprot:EG_transcript_15511